MILSKFARLCPCRNKRYMKKTTQLFLTSWLLWLIPFNSFTQDTFSIVAIDTLTGEIGSAGASCVKASSTYPHGAAIISDVIPGIGAIHTQAAWNPTNQQNAHERMVAGDSPQQIIDWLVANDAGGDPLTRQYGIVDFRNSQPRAASYTGANCMNYKSDTSNLFYAIQGNILLGQQIIDSMQVRFLGTQGTLADRLMAALQGAKVVGADTRCAGRNSSSLSAFLRVARPENQPDSLYLDLWMAYPSWFTGVAPVDPIDSLQTLYDIWKTTTSIPAREHPCLNCVKILQNPGSATLLDFSACPGWQQFRLEIYDIFARRVLSRPVESRLIPVTLPPDKRSILFYIVSGPENNIVMKGKVLVR